MPLPLSKIVPNANLIAHPSILSAGLSWFLFLSQVLVSFPPISSLFILGPSVTSQRFIWVGTVLLDSPIICHSHSACLFHPQDFVYPASNFVTPLEADHYFVGVPTVLSTRCSGRSSIFLSHSSINFRLHFRVEVNASTFRFLTRFTCFRKPIPLTYLLF